MWGAKYVKNATRSFVFFFINKFLICLESQFYCFVTFRHTVKRNFIALMEKTFIFVLFHFVFSLFLSCNFVYICRNTKRNFFLFDFVGVHI